jgi:hypothetical protein
MGFFLRNRYGPAPAGAALSAGLRPRPAAHIPLRGLRVPRSPPPKAHRSSLGSPTFPQDRRSQPHRERASHLPATVLARQSRQDANSIVANAGFLDPANGDYRVADDSPAIGLGFKNFAMDQLGVKSPHLRKQARSPKLPQPKSAN